MTMHWTLRPNLACQESGDRPGDVVNSRFYTTDKKAKITSSVPVMDTGFRSDAVSGKPHESQSVARPRPLHDSETVQIKEHDI